MKRKVGLWSFFVILISLSVLLLPQVIQHLIWTTSASLPVKLLLLLAHTACISGISFMLRTVLFDVYIEVFSPTLEAVIDAGPYRRRDRYILLLISLIIYAAALNGATEFLGASVLVAGTQFTTHARRVVFDGKGAWYVDDYSLQYRGIVAYKEADDDSIVIYLKDSGSQPFKFSKRKKSLRQELVIKLEEYNIAGFLGDPTP